MAHNFSSKFIDFNMINLKTHFIAIYSSFTNSVVTFSSRHFQASSSPPRMHKMERESPPIHHPPTLLHPALLAAAQHGGSPEYSHMRVPSGAMNMDNGDRNSDCNSGDISYDGMQPTISFLCKDFSKNLSSQHVRNLIFIWVRVSTKLSCVMG